MSRAVTLPATPPVPPPPKADAVVEALHEVMHRLRHQQHAALRQAGQDLTPLEGRALGFFARHAGATAADLAGHSSRDKGQLTRLLAGLKGRGLLDVVADPDDRRVQRLHLSPAGRAELDALQRLRQRLAERAVASLSPADRQQLLALLQRVSQGLAEG